MKHVKPFEQFLNEQEEINEAVPFPIVPPVFSGGSSGNKIFDIIYIILYLLYAAAIAAPIFLVAIPDWFKEKAEQYKLNKKSTKEEIRRAAEDLATQLTTREKNYLAKLVDKMDTTKGDGSLRAQQVTNAKRYLDTLKSRYK